MAPFSLIVFGVVVWTIAVSGAKRLRFRMKTDSWLAIGFGGSQGCNLKSNYFSGEWLNTRTATRKVRQIWCCVTKPELTLLERLVSSMRTVRLLRCISPSYHPLKDLRGCPPKNRPLNSDQNSDFLQNFSTKQGWYKVKENAFLWFLFSILVEILRRMWSIPETLKLGPSRSRN